MADQVGEARQVAAKTTCTSLLRELAESSDVPRQFRNRLQNTLERSHSFLTPRYQSLVRLDDEKIAAMSRQFDDLSRNYGVRNLEAQIAWADKQEAEERARQLQLQLQRTEERARQLQRDLDIAKEQVQEALDSAQQGTPATSSRQSLFEAHRQNIRFPKSEPSDDEDEDDGIQFNGSVIDPTSRRLDERCPEDVYGEVRDELVKAKQAYGDKYLSVAANRYRCASSHISNSKCYWSVQDAGLYACKTCTNMKRPCFTVTLLGNVYIRPLPEEFWPYAGGDSGRRKAFSVDDSACFINKTGVSTNRYTHLWTSQAARAKDFAIPEWQ